MKRALAVLSAAILCGWAEWAAALPNPPPLRFLSPALNAVLTTPTVGVQVDASCTFDPQTLVVTINGTNVPTSQFLPFSACANNRITSAVASVSLSLPNGSISSAPVSLNAGQTGNFSGSGNGDALSWNFDGGAAPATGSSTSAIFKAAGQFTVRLRATLAETLAGSGMDNGNLVSAQRPF